jgi:DHA1 family tetracycline resistance protein-like MFS transporter
MDLVNVGEALPKRQPLLTNLILLFLFAMILANIGGNMYGPLLSLYIKDLGASVEQIGLFFTLSQVIPLALQILGGWISDTLGRLRAIAIGSVIGIFTYIALISAPTWQWLLLAMAFQAVTGSLIGPSFDAFLAEHSNEQNRAKMFGISQALYGIVGVIGPVMGGWLVDLYGFKIMLMVAAGFYVLATIIRVSMAREAARKAEAKPEKLSFTSLKSNLGTMFGLLIAGGVITWILITDGVRDISFGLSMNFLPVYMQQYGLMSFRQIGLMNSIFGLFLMLSTIPGGWLADKISERFVIILGFISIGGALWMLIARAPAPLWFYGCGWVLAGIGVGLMTPAYQSLISKAVPKKVRGTAFGLFSSSLGLVSLPAPWVGGLLWEKIGPRSPFMITAGVSFLSVIPAWLKFRLPKNNGAEKDKGGDQEEIKSGLLASE